MLLPLGSVEAIGFYGLLPFKRGRDEKCRGRHELLTIQTILHKWKGSVHMENLRGMYLMCFLCACLSLCISSHNITHPSSKNCTHIHTCTYTQAHTHTHTHKHTHTHTQSIGSSGGWGGGGACFSPSYDAPPSPLPHLYNIAAYVAILLNVHLHLLSESNIKNAPSPSFW